MLFALKKEKKETQYRSSTTIIVYLIINARLTALRSLTYITRKPSNHIICIKSFLRVFHTTAIRAISLIILGTNNAYDIGAYVCVPPILYTL